MHRVRSRRSVAIVRELWDARDDIARERDISPGRVLPDAALVEIAKAGAEHRRRPAPRATGPIAALPAASGSRPCAAPSRSPRTTCRRARCRPTGRRRRGPGPTENPWPPPGWAPPGPRSPRSPRSTSSRSRTSARPTRCAGWCGSRPTDHDEAAFTRALLDLGCRPWQAEIVAPMLVAAFEQFPELTSSRRGSPSQPRRRATPLATSCPRVRRHADCRPDDRRVCGTSRRAGVRHALTGK